MWIEPDNEPRKVAFPALFDMKSVEVIPAHKPVGLRYIMSNRQSEVNPMSKKLKLARALRLVSGEHRTHLDDIDYQIVEDAIAARYGEEVLEYIDILNRSRFASMTFSQLRAKVIDPKHPDVVEAKQIRDAAKAKGIEPLFVTWDNTITEFEALETLGDRVYRVTEGDGETKLVLL